MPPTRKLITPAAIAAVLLLAGCTANADEPSPPATPSTTTAPASPTPEPPSPSSSPSPTALESFPSAPATEDDETAAIREGWEKAWTVADKYFSDPTLTDFQETQEVTVGEESTTIVNEITQLREANLKMVGGRTFRDVIVGEPTVNADGVSIAEVTYCRDDSGMELVDVTTGEVSGTKPEITTFTGTATMEQLPDKIWRLALTRDKSASC